MIKFICLTFGSKVGKLQIVLNKSINPASKILKVPFLTKNSI